MGLATRNAENVAIARRFVESFIDRDIDAFVAAMDEDIEARPAIGGAPVLSGPDAVERWWRNYAAADAEFEVRPLEFEARGDCVIVRGYLRHRQGRTLAESQVYWLYEIRANRIRRMESHPTRRAALAAV